jgi:hypothetical protein
MTLNLDHKVAVYSAIINGLLASGDFDVHPADCYVKNGAEEELIETANHVFSEFQRLAQI